MLTRRAMLAGAAAQAVRGQMFADAEAYERFMGRWSAQLAPLLVEFGRVPERGEVLDIGSGTGALAFAIARMRPECRVTGIDPSKEYVAYAASRSNAGSRVKFEVGDAQAMGFAARRFDGCSSLLVFNFIPDARKALGEAVRVTKAGGWVSAAVWDYGGGMRMLRQFWDAAGASDKDERRMPLCRKGELGALWRAGGLGEIAEEGLEFTMRFASFEDYWEPFLLGQGPAGSFVKGLSGERRDRLKEELKARVKSLEMPARAWGVRGRVR